MRMLLVLATLVALSASALAQGFNMDERIERLRGELGLNDEQVNELKAAYGEFMQKMGDFRNNPDGDFRARMEELRAEVEARMAKVLSAEQLEKARDLLGGRRREVSPEERDSRRLGRAIERMQLTPEETDIVKQAVDQVLKVRREHQATVQAKRQALSEAIENSAAEDDLKAKLAEVQIAEEAAQTAIRAADADLREILTVKQQSVLVSMGILRASPKVDETID